MIPENTSSIGKALIKKFEGCHDIQSDGRVHSYRDPVGVWTIGYGHTKGVKYGQSITMAEAEAFLIADIQDAVIAVRRYVKVPLTQNQFDPLVSFTFNLGSGNLRSSTLLRLLNDGQYAAVPEQLARWNKGKVDGKFVPMLGLTRRRSAEGAMFMMDEKFAADGGSQMVQKPRAGTTDVKPLSKSRTLIGATLGGVGTVMTAVLAQAGEVSGTLTGLSSGLEQYTNSYQPLMYATLALSMAGAVLAAYARWDDNQKAVK
jgi:lysozyme